MMVALALNPAPRTAGAALSAYGAVSLAARVETASPHMLVQLLFDKLLMLVREARAAAQGADAARRLRATGKAIAIVDGLDATLDDSRGGDVAASLHAVYRLVSERLLAGQPQGLAEAEDAITAIAGAWKAMPQLRPMPESAPRR